VQALNPIYLLIMDFNAYIFKSEKDLNNAKARCNAFFGVPKKSDDITKNYIDGEKHRINNEDVYVVFFTEELRAVLGEPVKIKLKEYPS